MADKPKQLYFDFDEYIRLGEPEQQAKAANWNIAIGLQAVDGLKPSKYLIETAKRNIEGEISIDEVRKLIHSYYVSKSKHESDDSELEEADRVSSNIAKLLNSQSLNFTLFGYTQIHKNIFDGVFKFAGKIRDYEISKREWVLRGDTVSYAYPNDLRPAIEYDLEQERQFNYGGLSRDEIISLKNRYLIINPPAEYAEQPRLDVPTSTEQVDRTSTEQVVM